MRLNITSLTCETRTLQQESLAKSCFRRLRASSCKLSFNRSRRFARGPSKSLQKRHTFITGNKGQGLGSSSCQRFRVSGLQILSSKCSKTTMRISGSRIDMAFDKSIEAVQAISHSPQHSSVDQRDESSLYVHLAARDYDK